MASVAICPHCYLQLVVPDGVEPDEKVECPTCSREFSLDRAVLRAIPEVIRRVRPAAAPTADSTLAPETVFRAEAEEIDVAETEVVEQASAESADIAAASPADDDFVAQLKSRIEQELSAGNLLPGTNVSLSLESPAGLEEPRSLASDEPEPLDQWHRPTVRLSNHAELDIEHDEESVDAAAPEPITSEQADEIEVEDAEYTPLDTSPPRPAATTLADLMPPLDDEPELEESAELADEPGPSFELPDVQLTPSSSATVEFDPNISFGPAAESEFELDSVDFDSTPVEDEATDDIESEIVAESEISDDEYAVASAEEFADEPAEFEAEAAPGDEESAEAHEPVFGESPTEPATSAPFILPGLPPRRRRRSVVRTLVGTALGGIAGTVGALYALLWILGPDGDYLQVAKYLPSAALPKSFEAKQPTTIARTQPPKPIESEPVAAATADSEPAASENIPATFTQEVEQPESDFDAADSLAAGESANRYGEEPSPLEEPAAEPIGDAVAAYPEAPLPLAGPTYTLQQLSETLNSATEAQRGLIEGDLGDATVRRTKGMSYARLCDLAEALTFVERIGPTVEGEQAEQDAEKLFRETLADAHTRSEVDRIATLWIDSPHRSHGGVFLAGQLSGGDISGSIYEYELTIDDGGKFTLLAAEPLDPSVQGSSQPVGIVGSIVKHPSVDVTGYRGTADRAIWVTRAIPLD